MFLLDWYREFKQIKNESRVCDTCEALKLELAKAHDTNRELLQAITAKPEAPIQSVPTEFKPITPKRHLTFTMRKQMLEAEDRVRAKVLREQQRDATVDVKDDSKLAVASVSTELTNQLEQELNIVEAEREAQSGKHIMASGE